MVPAFEVSFAGALFAGLLSFASPCVLPLVPPYLAFLGGQSALMAEHSGGRPGAHHGQRARLLAFAAAFVLGFTTIFVALGASATLVSRLVAEHLGTLSVIAGGVLFGLGLHYLGAFQVLLLNREARFEIKRRPAGVIGAYIVGLAFAFGWTPCVGPVLAAILMVAASQDHAGYGAGLLAAYSFGIGIPFFLAAVFAGTVLPLLQRMGPVMPVVQRATGGFLMLTGLVFITGAMDDIAFWLLETVPALGRIG